MPLPQVSLKTGKVSWVDPTANTDGSAITTGEITGYVVGLRSLTASGSVVGTYPIQSPPAPATAVSEALSAITASLVPDSYAASVQALAGSNAGPWGVEFQFQGVPSLPNAPTGISVS